MITPVSFVGFQTKTPTSTMHPQYNGQSFKASMERLSSPVLKKTSFLEQMKDIFRELMPFLDKEYRNMMKKAPKAKQPEASAPVAYLYSRNGFVLGALPNARVKKLLNNNPSKIINDVKSNGGASGCGASKNFDDIEF